MEHLALEVFDRDGSGSKYAFLPSDTSITITDTSEIFDSGDIWSHAFKLNIPANAHIFGSAGEIHGSRLHEQIDKRRARLWVEGLPLYYGYLRLDDEVDVDEYGDVNVSFESGQKTFKDMIEGAKANQVPLKDDVFIGMALDRDRTVYRNAVAIKEARVGEWAFEPGLPIPVWYNCVAKGISNFAQQFPKYVKPDGKFKKVGSEVEETIPNTINNDFPYDTSHPYCNTRICYQAYEWKSNNGSLEKTAKREYRLSNTKRINPSPNFYVLYWLDCLMKHLNIYVEENSTMYIEDMRRLFFVNTKCAYTTKNNVRYKIVWSGYYDGYDLPLGYPSPFVPPSTSDEASWELEPTYVGSAGAPGIELSFQFMHVGFETNTNHTWRKAYATSENFPDVSISEVIDAIENGFGVRFLFNKDYTKVRIVMLRDVLSSQEVQEVACEVEEVTKQENNIRGFRLTYGAGEDNTYFFYRGFADKLTHKDELWPDQSDTHDYSQWDLTKHYPEIKGNVGMLNKTCYIDMDTGNAYIVKIDADFKNMKDKAYPSLFSCADFMDAEDGDCTGEEETIKEVRVGFSPIIENAIGNDYALLVGEEMEVPGLDKYVTGEGQTVEMAVEPEIYGWTGGTGNDDGTSPTRDDIPQIKSGLFEIATATHVDIESGESDGKFHITLATEQGDVTYDFTLSGYLREGYRLYLRDNYKPDDDLTSPFEKVDWGLTLGIMRGSGSDAYIQTDTDPDDHEGNQMWSLVPGSNAYAHSDTCNDSGVEWDYNGSTVVGSTSEAIDALLSEFPYSNADLVYSSPGVTRNSETFIIPRLITVKNNLGNDVSVLVVRGNNKYGSIYLSVVHSYMTELNGMTAEQMYAYDKNTKQHNIIIEVGSNWMRRDTLLELQRRAFGEGGYYSKPMIIDDNGVGSAYGRFSLKLRAEKPNPMFDSTQEETHYDPEHPDLNTNPRYLHINTPSLQHRGLADQFYKEYSYWVRNARIAKMEVRIELAQLLAIDKTKRVRIGDITGFVKEMQYSVDIQSGMSNVMIEIWYL